MIYSVQGILEGIAEKIASFSQRPIYISQTQQACNPPCFFLSIMPGDLVGQIGRTLLELNVDIVFLQDPNIVNASNGIISVLESLDECMDSIAYRHGQESTVMLTYDRRHHLEGNDLHYNVSFKTRVLKSETETFMQSMEADAYVKKP